MKHSENINEIAVALSRMQGELVDVYKGSKGFGYNYADLSSVLEYIRPLLAKYELSIVQPVGGNNGKITVTTVLMHASGQFISEEITVEVDISTKKMNSLQAAGSTITYLRRYSLSSIIGLSSTDDDGKSGGDHLDENLYNAKENAKKDLMTALAAVTNSNNKEIVEKALSYYDAKTINELNTAQLQTIMHRINKQEI